LLPSEVERIEHRLPALLAGTTPDQATPVFLDALGQSTLSRRCGVEARLRAALQELSTDASHVLWADEAERVVSAMLAGLHRLCAQRALGLALYDVTNRLLGPCAVQALTWAQHTQAVAGLLAQNAWQPWLAWLCRLPLPSLRDGHWLEPLIAALPTTIHSALDGMVAAHDTLHRSLSPPPSPLRLLLLATVWALWVRQCPPAVPPATAPGRRIAALPALLEMLDAAGMATRQVLAAPAATAVPGTSHGLLAMAAAASASRLFPASPRANSLMPLAAMGLGLTALAPLGATARQAVHVPSEAAARDDRAALIDQLWSCWDTATPNASVVLGDVPFRAVPHSPFAHRQQQAHQWVARLHEQDDFLGVLYTERVPPSTLRMRNGTLSGRRVHTGAHVQLHPPSGPSVAGTWSPRTVGLLEALQAAVVRAGGCFDAGSVRLPCALQFYLHAPPPEGALSARSVADLIQRLEANLAGAEAMEAPTLERLHQEVDRAKAHPIRGLPPPWPTWRPDPRSHLGHNLALARGLLRQLAAHPTLVALCAEKGADPERLTFPAQGEVRASSWQGTGTVTLFQAEQPPAALAPLATPLRGLSTLLQAPVRANGLMGVVEMLAYYGAPWPGVALDDAPFDACLDALAQRLPPVSGTQVPGSSATLMADAPQHLPDQQALLDDLWQRFDGTAAPDAPFKPVPGSPLHRAWHHAQQRLLDVFESPSFWLRMRAANASFLGLRVAEHHVSAPARDSGRLLRINTTGLQERGELNALHDLVARVGCLSPASQPPLGAALAFHRLTPASATRDCAVDLPTTPPQWLALIQRAYTAAMQNVSENSVHRQAMGDLHDVRRVLASTTVEAAGDYRPSLGAASAQPAYGALALFAVLLEHPVVHALGVTHRDAALAHDGVLTLHAANGTSITLDTERAWNNVTGLLPVLQTLRAHAVRLGGRVRADGRVEVPAVLTTHGGCGPQANVTLLALLRCAERVLGEVRLGMRPHLVHVEDVLTPYDRITLREVTTAHLAANAAPDITLLEYLGAPLVERGDFRWDDLHRSRFFLAEIARSPRAHALQNALLSALGWYGAPGDAATSPTLLASLTAMAVVDELGPPSDRNRRIVLGYRLHKYANRGRTFAAIRDDFGDYLFSLGRLPAALRAMAVTLVLQQEAPELLGEDIPPDLVFGSAIAAASYASGVHVAERIQRGLSQQMNFSELVMLSAELARAVEVPDDVRKIALDARRLPMLDWLAFRHTDAGYPDPPDAAAGLDAGMAMAMFDARVARIETAVADLLAPLPYRMPMVEAELKRVFPSFPGVLAGLEWNSTQLRLCNDAEWFGYSFPLFELYAAGELQRVPHDWYACSYFVPDTPLSRAQGHDQHAAFHNQSFAAMQPGIARLAPINETFQRAFDAYFDKARRGYGVLIEEALHLRPAAERDAIARGEVEIFTLRTHEPDLEAGQETAADTDPYRGRFGVIYGVMVEGRRRYYQLFPLQSRILPLELDGELPIGGVLEDRQVRLRHGHYTTVQVRRGVPLDVDWEAYASFRVPEPGRRSRVIVEPLRSNATAQPDDPHLRRSPFHALVAPLQRDFFWLDPVVFHFEASGASSFETQLKAPPLWLKAVETFVPFVENLRRISSSDRNEFAMAAFGLQLEIFLVAGPLAGSVIKVLARPGVKMTLPRFAELAKVLGHGVLDALNPLAGGLAVARLGVGVVLRGVRGDLRFVWSWLRRPHLRGGGWRWAMREGMAVLNEGAATASASLQVSVRTVQGVGDVLVVAAPSGNGPRVLHLLDPAAMVPYGPALQPRLDASEAAGVLFKVGEGLRPPKPSPGKVLKPIKQGTRTSQEDSGERGETPPLSGIGGVGPGPVLP
jgi:hypothetical protein